MRIVQKLCRGALRVLVYLGQEAEPQDLHLLLGEVLRLELRQFHKHEVQTFENLTAVLGVNHPVVVVVPIHARLENLVDEIERIDRLEQVVLLRLVKLPDVCLGRIEEDSLAEVRRPVHLHLDNELASASLLATDIDNRVFACRGARHKFRRQIFYRFNLLAIIKRQQGVKEAYDEILVLAKNLLEGHIGLWIKVLCHVFFLARRFRVQCH